MLAKSFIVICLFTIIFVLFRGLYFLVKDEGNPKQTVRSLTWRIGLSLGLIILIIIGASTGIIQPHGLNKMPDQEQTSE